MFETMQDPCLISFYLKAMPSDCCYFNDYTVIIFLTPNPNPKVCATYMDGFRATAVCPVVGPRAAQKARKTAESIIKRFESSHAAFPSFININKQIRS